MPKRTTTQFENLAVLSALLRAGDAGAVDYLKRELKRAGGNLTALAEAIGAPRRTVYHWAKTVEGLAERLEPLIKRKPRAKG